MKTTVRVHAPHEIDHSKIVRSWGVQRERLPHHLCNRCSVLHCLTADNEKQEFFIIACRDGGTEVLTSSASRERLSGVPCRRQ